VRNPLGRIISEEIVGEMYGDNVEIERKYYDDEQIKSELVEGTDESLQREWYKNGQLKYKDISTYSDNLNTESYVDAWYENGQMSYQFAHHQEMYGFYFYRSWYENGQMKHNEEGGLEKPEFCDWFPELCDEEQLAELELVNEEKLADTAITFFIKNWYENGQLEYEKNNIVLRCWYKDGQLKKETFYKKDNEGESIMASQQCWDENGIKIPCSSLTSSCDPDFYDDMEFEK
jgi:antitoxin component YwqK of YwqJK toxin-antitoxin module